MSIDKYAIGQDDSILDYPCQECGHDAAEHDIRCRTDVFVARAWSKCSCTEYTGPLVAQSSLYPSGR